MSKDTFKQALAAARDGTGVPIMKLTRDEPQIAALVSKLVTAPIPSNFGPSGKRELTSPDLNRMKTLSDRTSQNVNDSETIMQILPEMELTKEILVSSIISPKDMVTTELNYHGAEGLMAADTTAAMTTAIRDHFEEVYKIKSQLGDMLRDMLFTTGSFVIAVIPENSIDELINGSGNISMEGLSEALNDDGSPRNLGLLGNAAKRIPSKERTMPGLSLESFHAYQQNEEVDSRIRFQSGNESIDTFISVCDNPDILKIPKVNRKIREQRISSLVRANTALEKVTGVGTYAAESHREKLSDRQLTSTIFKRPLYGYKPIATAKTQEQLNRTTVGSPLVLHLPSEAVIPVHVPGNPEEQIGYFVLIDAEGNFISKSTNVDHYQQMSNRFNGTDGFAGSMIKKVNAQMNGNSFDARNSHHMDLSTRIFGEMVEQDLISRLQNGKYGNGVAIARQSEVYRIMMARTFARQHTQLLFLPIELTTYFAFRYNDDGIGRSILEETKIINSLRAMMLFSNVMAAMKNSIGKTEVTLTFDEDDPDPMKAFETAIHEFMTTRQVAMPIGMNSPADITDWMSRAGYEFIPEGHPGMPAMKIGTTEKNTNYVKPDTDLEESLRKRSIMAFGVSPESVDSAFSAEFATTVVSNNLLLSKRATHYQERFMVPLSEHHRKVIRNSEGLLKELIGILTAGFSTIRQEYLQDDQGNKIDFSDEAQGLQKKLIINEVLEQFIRGFTVELPKPNSATLTSQLDALKIYADGLDIGVDAWINSEFLTSDTSGDVSAQVDMLKSMVKNHFLRTYMAENGIMTELAQLTERDENGKSVMNLYELQKVHVEAITSSLAGLMKGLVPMKNATNAVMSEIGTMSTPDESSTDSTSGDGSSSSGEDGGDDFPDFSMDESAAGGADAPDTSAPVEDGPEDKAEPEVKDDDTAEDDKSKEEKPEDKSKDEDKPAE